MVNTTGEPTTSDVEGNQTVQLAQDVTKVSTTQPVNDVEETKPTTIPDINTEGPELTMESEMDTIKDEPMIAPEEEIPVMDEPIAIPQENAKETAAPTLSPHDKIVPNAPTIAPKEETPATDIQTAILQKDVKETEAPILTLTQLEIFHQVKAAKKQMTEMAKKLYVHIPTHDILHQENLTLLATTYHDKNCDGNRPMLPEYLSTTHEGQEQLHSE